MSKEQAQSLILKLEQIRLSAGVKNIEDIQ